jgi:hypothetical protein
MPLTASHCAINSLSVMFATIVADVTLGSGDTPASQAIAGIGVSPFTLEAPESEPALFALHREVATHRRPPSAAESSA